VLCDVRANYEFDDEWEIIYDSFRTQDLTQLPTLPKDHGEYKTYRKTVYGCHAWSRGILYSRSAHNLIYGFMYRLTNLKPGHNVLRVNQRLLCNQVPELHLHYHLTLIDKVKSFGDPLQESFDFMFLPHIKQKLRIRSAEQTLSLGKLLSLIHTSNNKIVVKTGELLPPGKAPRVIGDLSTNASIVGSLLAKIFKVVSEKPFRHRDLYSRFQPNPDTHRLIRLFKHILNPIDSLVHYFFSDDSIMSYRCSDGLAVCNLDISSCDSSITSSLFDLMISMWPVGWDQLARACVEQLLHKVKIYSGKYKLKVKPLTVRLLSGSSLTTLIDGLGNQLIGYVVSENVHHGMTKRQFYNCVEQSGRIAGFDLTIQIAEEYSKLQFLKFSPVYTSCNQLTAILNIGAIVRNLGSSDKRLPGKGPILQRYNNYMRGVISGYEHAGNHIVFDILRTKYPHTTNVIYDRYHHITGKQPGYVDQHELFKRYDLTHAQIDEFLYCLRTAGYGDLYNCPALQRILNIDYGL
jgi:hypothetical protein